MKEHKMIEFTDNKVPIREDESAFDHCIRQNKYWHIKNHPYKVTCDEMLKFLMNNK